MKVEALKKRLDRNRPMTTITIRIPEEVIEDLNKIAAVPTLSPSAQLRGHEAG
jgi:tRNA A37 threonylcarbamoyladenosine synthetase subunit TsaC/SUA5/YrdC